MGRCGIVPAASCHELRAFASGTSYLVPLESARWLMFADVFAASAHPGRHVKRKDKHIHAFRNICTSITAATQQAQRKAFASGGDPTECGAPCVCMCLCLYVCACVGERECVCVCV